MKTKQDQTVTVIGAGVVGLTAALAMRLRGFHVIVCDKACTTMLHPERYYALNHASIRLLSTLNVRIIAHDDDNAPYRNMLIWDAQNGAQLDFDARSCAQTELGFIVKHDPLMQQLRQQCCDNAIIFKQNTVVDDIINEPDALVLGHQNNHWQSDLLMITDGAHSSTRAKLQVPITEWSYHQEAIITTVKTQKPHQQTAYQVFHPDGPLAFLPLANAHHCSIVWSASPARIATLIQQNDLDFAASLTEAFAAKLGQTHALSARLSMPLRMRHTNQYVGSRWLLMGDAAHTIHPLAGLGLNLGLADVSAWLKLMTTHKHPLNSPRLLNNYQRQRKHQVWQTIALMEGLKRVFAITTPPVGTLRGLGLRVLNQTMPIKRWLIEQASGTT